MLTQVTASGPTGSIIQVYGRPTDPVVGTYYDTIKPSKGAQLTVNFLPYRRRAIVATGTPFKFIPTVRPAISSFGT